NGPKPRQKGRSQAAFCVKMHKQENTRQIAKAICSGSKRKPPKRFTQSVFCQMAKTWTDDASVAWITRGGAAR
ncbi:hypothetical protein ACCS87_36345, partial [Rhizobium ruizarguesonis]